MASRDYIVGPGARFQDWYTKKELTFHEADPFAGAIANTRIIQPDFFYLTYKFEFESYAE